MKKILISLAAIVVLMSVPMGAQGSLSQQVLQLLTRNNTWSGINTYLHSVGVKLERGAAPTTVTDRLYNVGGNLYFNGTVLASASSAGTVTSVDISVPNILQVAGNPITSSGTIAITAATQSANTVWAGPVSGGAATPTFRNLVAADIPGIAGTYLTASSTATLTNKSGNISMWTNDSAYITNAVTTLSSLVSVGTITSGTWHGGIIPGTYGGTGVNNSTRTMTIAGNLTTAAAFTTSGANALTLTTTGATNVTLPTTGTLITSGVTTLSSLTSIGTIATGVWTGTAVGVAYGGTNIASYAVGDILYASGATTLSKLADVATGNVLISGGVTTAPSWGKVGLTTAVSGTLAHGNGGIDITTVTDDTTLVASGTAWVAKALGNGVLSYNTSTNTFSVPTTFILGSGAPTPSVNNILLRSNTNGVLEVMLGNASAYAWLMADRLAIGNNSDPTFASTYSNFINAYSGADFGASKYNLYSEIALTPSGNFTNIVEAATGLITAGGVHNYTGVYGGDFETAITSSGTTSLSVGLYAGAFVSGVGTTTANYGFVVNAAGSGTTTITTNHAIQIESPTVGSTLTTNAGLYVADQTVTSTNSYAFYYAAPSSKEAYIKADGTIFFKELMTGGAAGSKKVVCVDSATGRLYSSSTSTDCSN